MLLTRSSVCQAPHAPAPGSRVQPVVAPTRLVSSRLPSGPSPVSSLLIAGQVEHKASRQIIVSHGQANSSLSLPVDLDLEQPLAGFDSIASALEDLAAGKLVVVIDDEDRENEGDLIMNADKVTTETMAFLIEYTSGVVCISMEGSDLDRLRLPLMVSSAENEESMYTAFTITVDLRDGITTGISASDRAKTIRHLANPAAGANDFRRPGHIFPLRYRPGGVLVRPGHTEAAVDLARLSGSFPAGVLCELVNKQDGSMSRTPELLEFAKRHQLKCITIADLIRYRMRHDALVAPVGEPTPVTTQPGASVTVQCFRSVLDGTEHLAFVHGAVADSSSEVLVHVQHERTLSDLLDCSEPGTSAAAAGSSSLRSALRAVSTAGSGVVVYLRNQTARGVPPSMELATMADLGSRTGGLESAELKDAAVVTQMLRALGVRSVALAGGDASLATALRSCGLSVRVVPAVAAQAGTGLGHHAGNGSGGHVWGQQQPLQPAGLR